MTKTKPIYAPGIVAGEKVYVGPHDCDCGNPATRYTSGERLCDRCWQLQTARTRSEKQGYVSHARRVLEQELEFAHRVSAEQFSAHVKRFWHARGMQEPETCRCHTSSGHSE